MVQHLLLTMVAAPLLALGAPITLLLRVSSPETRRRRILPVLHSRLLRAISFPVVTWIVFAAVMWGSHFSPLFDASLDNEAIHLVEHALYLGAALLFWWPVFSDEPESVPTLGRIAYVFAAFVLSAFLGLALTFAPPLYGYYESLPVRLWGISAAKDQNLGGILMTTEQALILFAAVVWLLVRLFREEDEAEARLQAEQRAQGLL
jgi:cytochrome c oxidase assembly factor CtaG